MMNYQHDLNSDAVELQKHIAESLLQGKFSDAIHMLGRLAQLDSERHGNIACGLPCLELAISLAKQIDKPILVAESQISQLRIVKALGHFKQAEQIADEVEAWARSANKADFVAGVLQLRMDWLAEQNKTAELVTITRGMVEFLRTYGDPNQLIQGLLTAANQIAICARDMSLTSTYLDEMISIIQKTDSNEIIPPVKRTLSSNGNLENPSIKNRNLQETKALWYEYIQTQRSQLTKIANT